LFVSFDTKANLRQTGWSAIDKYFTTLMFGDDQPAGEALISREEKTRFEPSIHLHADLRF
jgi:hypothetical protein